MTARRTVIVAWLVCALCLLVVCAWGKMPQRSHDDDRVIMTLAIARWYGLTRNQAILLLAIHDHEAGRPGREFGIESIPCEFKDGRKSYLVNCARACETIKRRCPKPDKAGVRKFNQRYAEDPDWWKKIWREMKRYKNIIY